DPDPNDDISYDVFVWVNGTGEPDYDNDAPTGNVTGSTTYAFNGSDDTSYRWNVVAEDNSGRRVVASNGPRSFSIYVPDAPTAFNLSSPSNGGTVNTGTPTLDWQDSSDPDPDNTVSYTLQYDFDGSFTNPTEVTGLASSVYTFPSGTLREQYSEWAALQFGELDELSDDVTVYWRVLATDTNTGGTWSNGAQGNHWSFSTFFNELPNTFNLLSPANGGAQVGTDASFAWANNGDPDPGQSVTYTLEVADNSSFSGPNLYTFPTAGTYAEGEFANNLDLYTGTVFSDLSTAYWRVEAHDEVSGSRYSLSSRSVVLYTPSAPAAFDLLTPTDGSTVTTLAPTLTWEEAVDDDPNASITYTLEWAYTSDFATSYTETGIATESHTFEPATLLSEYEEWRASQGLDDLLPDDVTVYWRVQAIDGTNSDNTWSLGGQANYWSFDVQLQELVYTEDFASGSLAADWSIDNGGSSADTWYFFMPDFGSFDGPMMMANSYDAGAGITMNESLVMQEFDARSYQAVSIEYSYMLQDRSGVSDSLLLEYSLNDGTSWSLIESFAGSSTIEFDRLTDISTETAGEASVRLRFRYTDNGARGILAVVDDITVRGYFDSPPVIVPNETELVGFDNTATTIAATITDDSGLSSYNLLYGDYSGGTVASPTTLGMTNSIGNEYTATIPAGFHSTGDVIGWAIEATDDNSSTTRSPEGSGWYYYNVYDPTLDIPYASTTYNWYDIETSGTNLNLSRLEVIEVDFADYGFDSFTWYGQSYNDINVCSNGWITFSEYDFPVLVQPETPDRSEPNNIISLFSHVFDLDAGGDVYVGVVGNKFVIQYENVFFDGESYGPTGQIVLDPATEGVYLNYETTNSGWTKTYTAGYENENGDLGDCIQYGTDWSQVASGTSYRIGQRFGTLSGTVTDDEATPSPLVNATITVTEGSDVVATASTLFDGSYSITTLLPGTYNVNAFLSGYQPESQSGVVIQEHQTTTRNFQLAAQSSNVSITGTVESADSPGTMVSGVTVSIPDLGVSDITDTGGNFDLGVRPEGYYTITVSHSPAGSAGYHSAVFVGLDINSGTVPLSLQIYEILPPTGLTASTGNARVALDWDAPSNHPTLQLNTDELRTRIEERDAAIARVRERGTKHELAFIQPLQRELHMLRSTLARHELVSGGAPVDGLDDLSDFMFYRIRQNGALLPAQPFQSNYTVTGLDNFREYEFEVAADYGYGSEYLVFGSPVSARPTGGVQYEVTELGTSEWIEINPANGGSGTPLNLAYNMSSTFIPMGGMTYDHYGQTYNQFAVSANGWVSFISNVVGYQGTLPSPTAPNALLAPFWMNLDPGTAEDANVWYYVDTGNNRVIVQWLADTYPGPNYRRKSFQVVMDCAGNQATFNYESASGGWTIDNNAVVGVEDHVGSSATTHNRSNITNGSSFRFTAPNTVYGNIVGTITSATTGDSLSGVVVTLTGHTDRVDTTGANGYYEFLGLDRADAPFEVVANKDGYNQNSVSGVGDPWGGDFEIVQNLALTEVQNPSEWQNPFHLESPSDGTIIASTEVLFEWAYDSPGPNSDEVFDLYVWSVGESMPDNPTASGLTEPSFTWTRLEDDQGYEWQVMVRDVEGNTRPAYGGPWSFEVYIPDVPSAFSLISPADGEVLETDTPTVTWEAAVDPDPDDTVTYTVIWSIDDESFVDPDSAAGIAETSYSFGDAGVLNRGDVEFRRVRRPAPSRTAQKGGKTALPGRGAPIGNLDEVLPDDVTIYWYVRAVDTNTDGTLSDQNPYDGTTWSFATAVPQPPSAPEAITPEHEAVIMQQQVRFEWTAAVDPDPDQVPGYRLELATDEQFTEPAVYETGEELNAEVEDLLDDMVYWWRVLATDTNTPGTWSQPRSFSMALPEAPTEFSLLGPLDGDGFTGEHFPLEFSWEASEDPDGDAVHYVVELSTDPEFAEPSEVDAGEHTSVEIGLDVINQSTTWFWRVKAVDDSEFELETMSDEEWSISLDLGIPERERGIPTEWALHSIYPNPFNPTVNIVVAVPELAKVNVTIYDVLGRQVAQLQNDVMQPGYHYLSWRASGLPSGMYFVRVSEEHGFQAIRKLMYMK
ncbi:T9SS type A sorting domain-containing protein, partial [bacterium]|nr:T9SS type A sorting domain-containing protein [bacterium]